MGRCVLPGMLMLALVAAAAARADRVVLIDGTASGEAKVKAIAADGAVTFGSKRIDLQELRRIEHEGVEADELPLRVTRVYLTDGSMLIAEALRVEGDRVTVDLAEAKGLSLPLASLRGAVFMPLSADEEGRLVTHPLFAAALADAHEPTDALFVIKDDAVIAVRGTLESLNETEAGFNWKDQSRTVGRDKVYGLTRAAPATRPDVSGRVLAHLKGGSTIWGIPAFDGRTLSLQRDDGLTLDLPWDRVLRLDVRSERLVYLSDLEPAATTVRAVFTAPYEPMMDRSVMDQPLRLDERTFERGIGMHAMTSMSWRIDGRYDWLAAVVGIDESVGDRGDCVVKVIGDGRELLSQRITGRDEPKTIRVNVAGVDRLELVAEPGPDVTDAGDRVDWADARLIKDKP